MQIDPDAQLDNLINIEITPSNFGRIAAQTAKQVVVQKLREAERSMIFEEFADREGEIVTGTIQRIESKIVVVNLGRTEGIMLPSDQISNERYEVGHRIKGYIYEVKNSTKGPSIFISRSHPAFLKRLFELEVPEIYDGLVEIKSIAREAGARSKISVHSLEEGIDSVGACVGPRGHSGPEYRQRIEWGKDRYHQIQQGTGKIYSPTRSVPPKSSRWKFMKPRRKPGSLCRIISCHGHRQGRAECASGCQTDRLEN